MNGSKNVLSNGPTDTKAEQQRNTAYICSQKKLGKIVRNKKPPRTKAREKKKLANERNNKSQAPKQNGTKTATYPGIHYISKPTNKQTNKKY